VRLALTLKISSPASLRSRHIHFERAANRPHSSPSNPWHSDYPGVAISTCHLSLGEHLKDGSDTCIARTMISAALYTVTEIDGSLGRASIYCIRSPGRGNMMAGGRNPCYRNASGSQTLRFASDIISAYEKTEDPGGVPR
jgi:hypothetical protein